MPLCVSTELSYVTELRLCGSFVDAECFFPDCLKSLKAVDLVGADDDNEVILAKDYVIEINSYKMQDSKAAETQGALSLCVEAIHLPSAIFHGAWERSASVSHQPLRS